MPAVGEDAGGCTSVRTVFNRRPRADGHSPSSFRIILGSASLALPAARDAR